MRPVFDDTRMVKYSQNVHGFDQVLHVAHFEWHGIRHATAYAPGHKLLIPSDSPLEDHKLRTLLGPDATKAELALEIIRRGITRIVFQGYSNNADELLIYLHSSLGDHVKFFSVNHVTPVQFTNHFETDMIARLFIRRRYGMLSEIGSVKPNFSKVFPEFWKNTIINYAPKIPKNTFNKRFNVRDVFAPLDIDWRKNFYTNTLAAIMAHNVDELNVSNFPNGLESITNLSKLRLVGYLHGDELFEQMATSNLVLLATLAECQPMTQLEAFAVGTPALTRDLRMHEFSNDPLIQLCTTRGLDDPSSLQKDIERVMDVVMSDPGGIEEMIDDHLRRRQDLATKRYSEFLGLQS